MRPIATALVTVAALLALAACGTARAADDGRLHVAAAFFPIAEIARNVGGTAVDVSTIVPPGDDPHEYEPTPKQVTGLATADVVLYLGHGFQPSVQDAVASLPHRIARADLFDGLPLIPAGKGVDPHVWLDPDLMATMVGRAAELFSAARPAQAAVFRANAAVYLGQLHGLAADLRSGLASCTNRTLVSSHRSYAYLARATGLVQASIAGISPGEEPSAKQLERIASFARDHHVTTIFFDLGLPNDLARTVASEAGATVAMLDPIETVSQDDLAHGASYVSLLRADLATLRTGLECS